MFKKTDLQRSLLENEFLLPSEKVDRLKKSWAEPFRERILPLIDEEVFHQAFSDITGRPNTSIRLMVGLHLLKDYNDLTDEQVLDSLEYNLQWHYALGIESDTAHVCQKTLHNFRRKLLADDQAQKMFDQVTLEIAKMDGLNLGQQRLDSTHVLSNIAVLTRLGLFVETVTHFLRELKKEAPEALSSLETGYQSRYLDREGYFSDAKKEQTPRRLIAVAQDIYELVRAFQDNQTISGLLSFGLLKRLFEEQCEIVEDKEGDILDGRSVARVQVRDSKTIASDSLQSPYDPDATYGHKGKGFEAQISETCNKDNPYQIITGVMVNGAHVSDQAALMPMIDQLAASGMKPQEIFTDTNYSSGANIVECAEQNVELTAPVRDPHAPEKIDHLTLPVCKAALPKTESQGEMATPTDNDTLPKTTANEPMHSIGLDAFSFDSTFHAVHRCPNGNCPREQHVVGDLVIAVFSSEHCASCPLADQCPTRLLSNGDRQLRRAPATFAIETRQAEQQTPHFKERYRSRSGIEPTNNELKDRHGLGDLRIRGGPRVKLAAQLKSLALNVKRCVEYHVLQARKCAPVPC